MRRALVLRREALAELAADELRDVAGGDSVLSAGSCPVRDCVLPLLRTRVSCMGCYTEPCAAG